MVSRKNIRLSPAWRGNSPALLGLEHLQRRFLCRGREDVVEGFPVLIGNVEGDAATVFAGAIDVRRLWDDEDAVATAVRDGGTRPRDGKPYPLKVRCTHWVYVDAPVPLVPAK